MQTETTRRALLGGAGLAVAIAATPVAAAGLTGGLGRSAMRPEFVAAHSAIATAEAEMQAHHPTFDAARERYLVALEAVPHVKFYHGAGLDGSGIGTLYTTADESMTRVCANLVDTYGRATSPHVRKLVAAKTWRDRKIERLSRQTGMDAAYDRDGELGNAVTAAEDRFAGMRPMSIAELRLMLQTANDRDMWANTGVPQLLSADVLRLTSPEGL
ncbi:MULTISPECIES: hypothetical protein [unclassified Sphingomonas]|uniref:hypothetical protein n=1 Tax=unclassified Sphingomonas TaxID=196159 RepID=UPI002269C061|nr:MULTISPECIES: hypothetical protein [unclassified Sphingomonas]